MKIYVGAKIIQAEPMDEVTFLTTVKVSAKTIMNQETRPGYLVIYPDGYKSWSPKETFETAYREVTEGERSLVCH